MATNNEKEGFDFLYAGRLSYSKNIFSLMDDFIQASKINSNIKLNIYGDFDYIGYRFHKYIPNINYIKTLFSNLIEASNGSIVYHGEASSDMMRDVYLKNDYFISEAFFKLSSKRKYNQFT